MSSPFLGEIRTFAFDWAPKGWAFCAGQLLSIQQNQALFSLLGTTYGGNGVTTFGLPDLRSRHGIGPDGSHPLGDRGGQENVTLNVTQLPAHNHQAYAYNGPPTDGNPAGAVWATSTTAIYATNIPSQPTTGATIGPMAPDALGIAGGSQPHPNQPPLLVINYAIALQGIFPSRN